MREKYCESCNKEVLTSIENEKIKYTIRGEEIIINGRVERCQECKEEINNNLLFEVNTNEARNMYINKYNIISKDEIKQLISTIGEESLINKTGISKITLVRYVNGMQ